MTAITETRDRSQVGFDAFPIPTMWKVIRVAGPILALLSVGGAVAIYFTGISPYFYALPAATFVASVVVTVLSYIRVRQPEIIRHEDQEEISNKPITKEPSRKNSIETLENGYSIQLETFDVQHFREWLQVKGWLQKKGVSVKFPDDEIRAIGSRNFEITFPFSLESELPDHPPKQEGTFEMKEEPLPYYVEEGIRVADPFSLESLMTQYVTEQEEIKYTACICNGVLHLRVPEPTGHSRLDENQIKKFVATAYAAFEGQPRVHIGPLESYYYSGMESLITTLLMKALQLAGVPGNFYDVSPLNYCYNSKTLIESKQLVKRDLDLERFSTQIYGYQFHHAPFEPILRRPMSSFLKKSNPDWKPGDPVRIPVTIDAAGFVINGKLYNRNYAFEQKQVSTVSEGLRIKREDFELLENCMLLKNIDLKLASDRFLDLFPKERV